MNTGRLAEAAPPGTVPFRLQRLGVLMAPLAGEPTEAWGVLNPATARREGETYLFPRMVAEGNFSRIGRTRVVFDSNGAPVDVERLGTALEPEEAWELHAGGGGVEDPRITHLPSLGRWIMTYVAFGPFGPRIGLAASADLERWDRLGPASFGYQADLRTDLGMYPNKDALLFPELVTDPNGRPAYAMLHRPMWDLSLVLARESELLPAGLADPRPGIWVSFAPAAAVEANLAALTRFEQHRLVALPEHPWEGLKIGGGTPPIRIEQGWLVLHHGVTGALARGFDVQPKVRYCAGALVLDPGDVTRVIARSPTPLLEPELPEEVTGTVGNVVFPTAIEPARNGDPSAFDVYYGMADRRIGIARLSRIATETGAT
jgi:beta-1,2-mannobiose phosphorylase / 1,2-beta-oligomannan phosphorylase